jgi:hypothetical protein
VAAASPGDHVRIDLTFVVRELFPRRTAGRIAAAATAAETGGGPPDPRAYPALLHIEDATQAVSG